VSSPLISTQNDARFVAIIEERTKLWFVGYHVNGVWLFHSYEISEVRCGECQEKRVQVTREESCEVDRQCGKRVREEYKM